MRSTRSLALALAVVAGAGAVVLAVRPWEEPSRAAAGDADPERCVGLPAAAARACYADEFLAAVEADDDPRAAVEEIGASAWRQGGFLLSSCHGIMHTVGRRFAADAGLTLASLRDHLPRSNDPGCAAGFAHGLVTGVAPSLDPSRPAAAAAACAEAGTRYQRYSCVHGFGHAFMRIEAGRLPSALGLCRALGAGAAPDCAQGAFHDYWFAVVGADEAVLAGEPVDDPRELCARQPEPFVGPCWYRAYVDNRPGGIAVASPEHFEVLCRGLDGAQRRGCVAAVSVIGPADPAAQLELCAALAAAPDAAACVRGAKVQNLLGSSVSAYVDLTRGCERFAAAARSECYRWLGKVVNVVTDGEFERAGCVRLASGRARRECVDGARSWEQPLATFS